MEQCTLDAAGNMADAGASVAITFGIGGGEYDVSRSVNALNQIAAVDGISPVYDARGNLTQYQGMTYSYDAFNRLVTATGGSDGAVTVSYDAPGRRTARTVSGTGTYYNFSDDQVIEERSTGALLRQYVWGQYIDELTQQREFARAPSGMASIDYYPLSDLHYRTVALTQEFCGSSSSAGPGGVVGQSGIVEVYDIDPWGKTTAYSE